MRMTPHTSNGAVPTAIEPAKRRTLRRSAAGARRARTRIAAAAGRSASTNRCQNALPGSSRASSAQRSVVDQVIRDRGVDTEQDTPQQPRGSGDPPGEHVKPGESLHDRKHDGEFPQRSRRECFRKQSAKESVEPHRRGIGECRPERARANALAAAANIVSRKSPRRSRAVAAPSRRLAAAKASASTIWVVRKGPADPLRNAIPSAPRPQTICAAATASTSRTMRSEPGSVADDRERRRRRAAQAIEQAEILEEDAVLRSLRAGQQSGPRDRRPIDERVGDVGPESRRVSARAWIPPIGPPRGEAPFSQHLVIDRSCTRVARVCNRARRARR